MNEILSGLIRTVVPAVVGVLLGQAARVGLDLPSGAVTEIVTVVLIGAYWGVARWLELNVHGSFGRVLLALGLTKQTPTYRA